MEDICHQGRMEKRNDGFRIRKRRKRKIAYLDSYVPSQV